MILRRGTVGKFLAVGLYLLLSCNFAWSTKINGSSVVPTVVLKDTAHQVLESHCISCHGPEKQKGDLRLDDFDSFDPVDLQELFARMSEVVQFREMPPDGSDQPNEVERSALQRWLGEQLHGEPAKALAEKLMRFEYGNVVSHTDLFSGEYAKIPGYTLDRRWLISEYIFNEKINRLLNYEPKRKIYGVTNAVNGDSGVHWSPKTEHGNKFRRTITNPFLLPEKVGVRYYGKDALTTGHLLTMVGNAKRVAGHMTSESVIKSHYPSMYALMQDELQHRGILRVLEEFLYSDKYMDQIGRAHV